MGKYKLIINPFAQQDILDAREWYNQQKKNLGDELLLEVKQSIISIENNPFQYPEVKESIRKAIVNRFPYSIFFTISTSTINIFALFHTSRNPKVWEIREPY